MKSTRAQIGKVRQHGAGFAYVLAIIALMVATSTTFYSTARNSHQQQAQYEARKALTNQVAAIRTKVLMCGMAYPNGNNGTGFHPRFPATPNSGLLVDAVCPGSGLSLWNATDGVFYPPLVRGFTAWTYTNDGTSVRVTSQAANAGDARENAILDTLASKVGVSASRSGDTLTVVLLN